MLSAPWCPQQIWLQPCMTALADTFEFCHRLCAHCFPAASLQDRPDLCSCCWPQVIVVTGDNKATAEAVCRAVGVLDPLPRSSSAAAALSEAAAGGPAMLGHSYTGARSDTPTQVHARTALHRCMLGHSYTAAGRVTTPVMTGVALHIALPA